MRVFAVQRLALHDRLFLSDKTCALASVDCWEGPLVLFKKQQNKVSEEALKLGTSKQGLIGSRCKHPQTVYCRRQLLTLKRFITDKCLLFSSHDERTLWTTRNAGNLTAQPLPDGSRIASIVASKWFKTVVAMQIP